MSKQHIKSLRNVNLGSWRVLEFEFGADVNGVRLTIVGVAMSFRTSSAALKESEAQEVSERSSGFSWIFLKGIDFFFGNSLIAIESSSSS